MSRSQKWKFLAFEFILRNLSKLFEIYSSANSYQGDWTIAQQQHILFMSEASGVRACAGPATGSLQFKVAFYVLLWSDLGLCNSLKSHFMSCCSAWRLFCWCPHSIFLCSKKIIKIPVKRDSKIIIRERHNFSVENDFVLRRLPSFSV